MPGAAAPQATVLVISFRSRNPLKPMGWRGSSKAFIFANARTVVHHTRVVTVYVNFRYVRFTVLRSYGLRSYTMPSCRRLTALLAFLGWLFPIGSQAGFSAAVTADSPIPSGYESYSVFLICTPVWLLQNRKEDVLQLYDVFTAFGRALGSRNAAVWFCNTHAPNATSSNLDTNRSSRYCEAYHLLPSNSPYILVTRSVPAFFFPLTIPSHYYIVSLNGLDAAAITRVVATLTDQILVTGLNQSALDSATWWQRLYVATRIVIFTTKCYFNKVSVSIKTSAINAEISHIDDGSKC